MSEAKAAFRLRIGRLLRIVTEVTTSADGEVGGSQVVAIELTDHFLSSGDLEGQRIWVASDGGEARRIAVYEPTSGETKLTRPFSTNPIVASTDIIVYMDFTPDDIDRALEQALSEVYPYLAQVLVDESLTTIAGQHEYTIPATILDLEPMLGGRVLVEDNTGVSTWPYAAVPNWSTRRTVATAGSTYTLLIPPHIIPNSRTLRLIGLGELANPATDAALIPLESQQLVLLSYKVVEVLFRNAPVSGSQDKTFAEGMEGKYRGLYEGNKDEWAQVLVLSGVEGFVPLDLPLAFNFPAAG